MTNPTPHGQVPEALRLAEEISNLVCSSEAAAKTIAAAADELCRLHVENASLRAALAATPTPPAEQQAQPGAVYAELPAPTASIGTDDAWHEAAMRDFADRTHALRMQAAPKAAPGVPIEIERAIRAVGLTLVKTTNGYSLLKLGKVEAQVEQPSCLQVKHDEWDSLPLGAQRLLIAATKAAPGVGNSGFDHKTAADLLNNKTVSDEAVRNFVATSRWAHDERAALSATLLAMHGVLTSREAEIALLKKALLEAETAPQPAPDCHHRPPCDECAALAAQGGK